MKFRFTYITTTITALLIFMFAATLPCDAGVTVRGNLFTVFLGDGCDLELRYPALGGGEDVLRSVSLAAGGQSLACSRFKLQETWLYFTARDIKEVAYKGTIAIEKPGVLKFELVSLDESPVDWEMTFAADPSEHYYGFGGNSERLDRMGSVAAVENIGADRNHNATFFSSSRGYGVWLNNTEETTFDMNSGGDGKWSMKSGGDSLRLYFFAGPKITDVISRYTSLSGRSSLLSRRSFAPVLLRDGIPGEVIRQHSNNLYSGENKLESAVVSAQGAAMSGQQIWSPDILLNQENMTREMFIRWAQFSALTPTMKIFMEGSRDAGDLDSAEMELPNRYAKLHTSLFPYIYYYAVDARDIGLPIIRPLPMLFQNDPQAHVQRYQYLLGSDILVAPVVQDGATVREVYFPGDGKWYEFWGDASHDGGTVETLPAPLEEIPFFVREGAIIPMLPDDVDTLEDSENVSDPNRKGIDDRLIIRVWPSQEKSRKRFVDGTIFVARREGNVVTLEAAAEQKRLWLDVAATRPSSVRLDDAELEKFTCREVIAGREGWCYSVTLHDTVIHVKSQDKTIVIKLEE